MYIGKNDLFINLLVAIFCSALQVWITVVTCVIPKKVVGSNFPLQVVTMFVSRWLLSAVVVCLAHYAASSGDNGRYLQVESKSFHAYMQENIASTLILVNFYVPWCGYCISLNEVLKEVASELSVSDLSVQILSVDVTGNKDIIEKENIDGYPTIALYKNGMKASEYYGDRSKESILSYLQLKGASSAIYVSKITELGKYCATLPIAGNETSVVSSNGIIAVVLGIFLPTSDLNGESGLHSKIAEVYKSLANKYDQAIFLISDDQQIISHYNIKQDTMLVYIDQSGGVAGSLTLNPTLDADNLISTIINYAIPVKIVYSNIMQPYIQSIPIKVHALVFYDDKNTQTFDNLVSVIDKVGPLYRGSLIFIMIPGTEHYLLQFFDIALTSLPRIIIADMKNAHNMKKYDYHDYYKVVETVQTLTTNDDINTIIWNDAYVNQFILDYFNDKLTQTLQSQEEADVSGSDADKHPIIKSLVGTNFAAAVADDAKDVIVYFYAPWCGHCKSVESVVNSVAEIFKNDENLIIAKIDASKNDISYEGVTIKGYPTFYLFVAGNKSSPVEYTGDRSYLDLINFITVNGAVNKLSKNLSTKQTVEEIVGLDMSLSH